MSDNAGAKVNAQDEDGRTLLHYAAKNDILPANIIALIKAGAKVNAKTEGGWTLLHDAARNRQNPAIITAIIKAGADIEAENEDGNTPLYLAAKYNKNPAIIATLINAGASVTDAIIEVAKNNEDLNQDIINLLKSLKHKTNPYDTQNYADMVNKLVKSGQEIKATITFEQLACIHMAMGISGEAGELLDAVKKSAIYQKDLDIENIIEELGDIEFYLEGFRQSLNLTRLEIIEANIKKLEKRYKNFKYTDEAAIKRLDKLKKGDIK